MYLSSYIVKTGVKINDRVILDVDRSKYLANSLGVYLSDWMKTLSVGDKVAVLYAAGPAIHHSDSRNIQNTVRNGTIVIKSQIGYSIFELLREVPYDIEYVSGNTNTCASSMYSLYEAYGLLKQGFTDVIVLTMEMVEETQELLFKQLGINLLCGDGVAGLHFSNNPSDICISEVTWKWNKDVSPMSVSSNGYHKVLADLDVHDCDVVKLHGSGTERNTIEELAAVYEILPNVKTISYKESIGHTQGASTAIEMCLLTDDTSWKKAVMLASGLGGFYGGCVIRRLDGYSKNCV